MPLIKIKNSGGSGGGGLKQQYRYEVTLYTWGCRVKKYYNGSLVSDEQKNVSSWNTYVWRDDIVGVYGYQDATTYLRVDLIQPMIVNGTWTNNGTLYSYANFGSGAWPTITVEYEIYRPQVKKKYLYKTGDEYTDITGGWRNMNVVQTPMQKLDSALRLYTEGGATQNRRGYAFTINKVDVTKAFRLGAKISGREIYFPCATLVGEYFVCIGRYNSGWGGEATARYNIVGLPVGYVDPLTNNWVNCAVPSGAPQDINDITEVWLEE